MSTLSERAEAALRVIKLDHAVDRLLLFEQVIWPTLKVEQAESNYMQPVTAAELQRMVELAAQGVPHSKIGEQLGRPRSTVSAVLKARQARAIADRAVTV